MEIKEYEAMAKLSLSEEERQILKGRAEMLYNGFAELDKIETESTAPLITVLGLNNILREDVTEKRLTREEILKAAPEQSGGYFRVPGTLE